MGHGCLRHLLIVGTFFLPKNLAQLAGFNRSSNYSSSWTPPSDVGASVFAVLGVLGVACNVLVLVMMLCWRKNRSQTALFSNLAFTDAVLCTLMAYPAVATQSADYMVLSGASCYIWLGVFIMFGASSIFTVTTISLDRYLGVVRPIQRSTLIRTQASSKVIVCVWVLSLLLSLPMWGGLLSMEKSVNLMDCHLHQPLWYLICVNVFLFFLPFGIMTEAYRRVNSQVRRRCRMMAMGVMSMSKSTVAGPSYYEPLRVHIGRRVSGVPQVPVKQSEAGSSSNSTLDRLEIKSVMSQNKKTNPLHLSDPSKKPIQTNQTKHDRLKVHSADMTLVLETQSSQSFTSLASSGLKTDTTPFLSAVSRPALRKVSAHKTAADQTALSSSYHGTDRSFLYMSSSIHPEKLPGEPYGSDATPTEGNQNGPTSCSQQFPEIPLPQSPSTTPRLVHKPLSQCPPMLSLSQPFIHEEFSSHYRRLSKIKKMSGSHSRRTTPYDLQVRKMVCTEADKGFLQGYMKTTVTLVLILTIFLVFWLPFFILLPLCYLVDRGDMEWLDTGWCFGSQWWAMSHSLVNPFLYAWAKAENRKAVCALLHCRHKTAKLIHPSIMVTRSPAASHTVRQPSSERTQVND